MPSQTNNRRKMNVAIAADNILSPLGFTTDENYAAVKAGRSEVRRYEGKWNIPEPFAASLIDHEKVEERCERMAISGAFTFFEKMAMLSIATALEDCDVDIASPRTLIVISTTKGNVDLLRKAVCGVPADRLRLGVAATAIAHHFGNRNSPLVVSNACISGVSAMTTATRMIRLGLYDSAVVCGVDVQSPFIISGFQSLRALSDEPCRPFDDERCGINLGDAAATIVLTAKQDAVSDETWMAVRGAMRNDGYHISGPSRTAEGSYRCLESVVRGIDPKTLAFINAHGTATLYNDEMESVAISRAGLQDVPVNSYKGYYGHTMGAAGVLESILSMRAVDDGTVIGTKGFNALGVSKQIDVVAANRPTDKRSFVKLISGFGGSNAAMLFSKGGQTA